MTGISNAVYAQDAEATADSVKTDTTETEKTSYEEIIKGAQKVEKGLINIYLDEDEKLYFEVPFNLLRKDMLLASTISEISESQLGTVGAKPVSPMWVQFTRVDSVLLLRKMQKRAIAEDGNPNIAEAIDKNSIGPIIKKFDIKAYNEDTTTAFIDITNYFKTDVKELSPFGLGMMINRRYSFDKKFKRKHSFVGRFKSFDDNLTIKSHLSYDYTIKNSQGRTVVSEDPLTVVMTRTLLLLPDEPIRPRIADPRVGIFTTGKRKYSASADKSEGVHFARRFDLEPKDKEAYQDGELTEPEEPIVFYVDSDFPSSWKPTIIKGIEDWNDTFEEIGFKNAIVARDYPENDPEFDPDNLKYNVVRYSPVPVQNAMGPSWIDPRSGEILNASVYVYHDLVRLINNWRFVQTAPADPAVRDPQLPESIKMAGIGYVIRHEIGHTLGFMHNFAGSSSITVESLRSPSFTQKYGTTHSIMDYARYNYVAQPGDKERGVKMSPPKFGIYDYYLVDWAYSYFPQEYSKKDVRKELRALVDAKIDDPRYRYGRHQGLVLDPRALAEDLGDDAIEASQYGIKNLQFIMDNLNEWVAGEDKDFTYRQAIWNGVIIQFVRYANHLYANVGGIYLNQKYAGDPIPNYKSAPREKQERALQFLLQEIKQLEWLEDEDVLKNLPLTGTPSKVLLQELAKVILRAPEKVHLSALKSHEKNPYTPEAVMEDIFESIWSKTKEDKSLNQTDKYLQKAFVESVLKKSKLLEQNGGNQQGIAFNEEYSHIDIPQFAKEQSIDLYGQRLFNRYITSAEYGADREISATFGRTSISFNLPPSLEDLNYAYLMKIKKLLQDAIENAPDMKTEVHYELLLRKIEKNIL
jgi:hypothetical protein